MMPRRLQHSLVKNVISQQCVMRYATKSTKKSTSPPASHAHLTGSTFSGSNLDKTIGWHMAHNTREMPYTNALRCSHNRVTFSNALLKKHSDALASGLLEIGLRPGDTMGLIQENNVESVIMQLACAKIGAILVRCTPTTEKEMDRYIQLYRFRMLTAPIKLNNIRYIYRMLPDMIPELNLAQDGEYSFRSARYPFLKQILMSDPGVPVDAFKHGVSPIHNVLLYGPFGYYENPLRRISMHVSPDLPALVLPDAVPLDTLDGSNVPVYTQTNLIATGQHVANAVGLAQGDRAVVAADFTEFFGAVVATFSILSSQSQLIIPQAYFREEDVLSSIRSEEATVLFITRDNLIKLLTFMDDSTPVPRTLRSVVVDMDLADSDGAELISEAKKKLGVSSVHLTVSNSTSLLSIDGSHVPEIKVISSSGRPSIVHKNTYGSLKLSGPSVSPFVWNELGALPTRDEDGFVTSKGVFKLDDSNKLCL
mmetsp:Transcript_9548/g.14108  ORF Transcript_9548/g.14108 Transcript_9548/m.14108 type:complete len:480 (-) Transcript_9548:13-1452(-)